jgi:hypothetical protein
MLYPVKENDRWGYIDSKGAVIVPLIYSYCDEFAEGMGALFDHDSQLFRVDSQGMMVMLQGNVQPAWSSFREGAVVLERCEQQGLLSASGEWIVPPQFVTVFSFSGGLAKVEATDDCMGAVDHTGKWVIPPQFTWLAGFAKDCDVCIATKDPFGTKKQYSLISRTGERIGCDTFAYGYAGGKGVLPVAKHCVEGLRYGLIDQRGDVIAPFVFEQVEGRVYSDYMGATKVGDKWGAIDLQGNWAVEPKFSWIGRYSEGLFVAAKGGKWEYGQLAEAKFGYVNLDGEWVIPAKFDDAWPFRVGLAEVSFNPMTPEMTSGYIDREGRYVWAPR